MASPVWTVLTIPHPASIWPYHAIPHNTMPAFLTTLAYHRTQCNTKSHHSIPPHAISHQLFLNPPCVWPLFLCLCVLWPHFNWTFLSFANKRLHNRSYVIASMVFTSGINPGFISNFLSPLQSKAKYLDLLWLSEHFQIWRFLFKHWGRVVVLLSFACGDKQPADRRWSSGSPNLRDSRQTGFVKANENQPLFFL